MIGVRPSAGKFFAVHVMVLLLATQCAFADSYLTGVVRTNGQCQFTLAGWNGVPFVVESSPDMVNWTPIQTNIASGNYFPISVTAADNTCFYRTVAHRVQVPLPVFAYALAAVTNIHMNGNRLITDSYNSTDTNLSTNGQYDSAKAGTNGSVASMDGIVNFGGCTINGSLYLGPAAIYGGSTTNVTGTIYSNYSLQFPDVALPITDASSNAIVWGASPGTTNSHDFTVNGYYQVTDSGNITVEPGISVTLNVVVQNFNPSSITVKGGITNSGSLVIYHNPPSPGGYANLAANFMGNAIASRPANFIYFGMHNVANVTLSGTVSFVGVVYAPDAIMDMNGGGRVVDVCGSLVAGQVVDNGRYFLHFDESLLTAGPFGYYPTLQ